jgi:hypothetical protein
MKSTQAHFISGGVNFLFVKRKFSPQITPRKQSFLGDPDIPPIQRKTILFGARDSLDKVPAHQFASLIQTSHPTCDISGNPLWLRWADYRKRLISKMDLFSFMKYIIFLGLLGCVIYYVCEALI